MIVHQLPAGTPVECRAVIERADETAVDALHVGGFLLVVVRLAAASLGFGFLEKAPGRYVREVRAIRLTGGRYLTGARNRTGRQRAIFYGPVPRVCV
jgi:hypothetical protein